MIDSTESMRKKVTLGNAAFVKSSPILYCALMCKNSDCQREYSVSVIH